MPAGAVPGAVDGFETVGANVISPAEGHDSHSDDFDGAVVAAERDFVACNEKPITAPIAMTPTATTERTLKVSNFVGSLSVAFRDFCAFFIDAPKTAHQNSGVRSLAAGKFVSNAAAPELGIKT